jgi:predicted ferric reductase
MTRKPKSLEELKRKKSECAPYTRVLIITEGEKTEPIYFEELRKHYQLSAVNIQIIGSGSDPKNITNKIKKIKESEKSKSEK